MSNYSFMERIAMTESRNNALCYIDRNEVEEMLRDYYDFDKITDNQWVILDKMVLELCNKRGINSDYSEEFIQICDLCCEKLSFPAVE